MDNVELFSTKVVPFTIYKKVVKNGKEHTKDVENITIEESRNMSCEPVMLWREKGTDYYYLAELPLVANRGTGIIPFLCYLYDDLNEEEKEIFKDRTINIDLTRKEVTKVYSKRKVK